MSISITGSRVSLPSMRASLAHADRPEMMCMLSWLSNASMVNVLACKFHALQWGRGALIAGPSSSH